jgi:hypothetical protein
MALHTHGTLQISSREALSMISRALIPTGVFVLAACSAPQDTSTPATPTLDSGDVTLPEASAPLPDAGAPPPTSPCDYPEEAISGKFTKIYDPSIGESGPWYINDHTFVRGDDGTWHVFGITHAEPANPLDENTFAHATSPTLMGPWTKHPPALVADPAYGETLLWAPYVLHEGGTFYMFYCAGGADHEHYQIELATSVDLTTWTRDPKPLFIDGFDARDPMVLRVGNQWVLYYTATSDPAGGHHVVAYRTSTDLHHWSARSIAFSDPSQGTGAGPTESPFVVARANDYYLFIGPREDYADTVVFHSKDPFHFDPNDQLDHFASHAAEIVEDVDGKYYISGAGWGAGGVFLAPLEWLPTSCVTLERSDYRATVETSPKAGLIAFAKGGKELLSSAFRRTGPYLGIGAFGANAPSAAAKSVSVSPDGKRVALKGISFPGQPVSADWIFCADNDGLDQRLTWHVDGDLTAPVWEVSLGLNSRLSQVSDANHVNANGDVPGFTKWTLSGDATTSLVMAYAQASAWREDNHWLSSSRGAVAWQPLWAQGGTYIPKGTYNGGLYRIAASQQGSDTAFANQVEASLAANSNTCPEEP